MNNIITYPPHISRDEARKNTEAEFENYSKAAWELRILFVEELVKDWNQINAAMRIGFNQEAAKEESAKFLAEPAVQKLIEEYRCPMWLSKGKTTAEKQILSGLWREANYFGWGATPASRISAYKALATYLKMDPIHKDVRLPDLINREALASLDFEEQKAFAVMLRKVAVKVDKK